MTAIIKHAKLIELLLRRSRDRQVTWKETADENTFQVSFPKSSVQICRNEDGVQVSLINDEDETVDGFTNYDLRMLINTLRNDDPFAFMVDGEYAAVGATADAVRELYHLARRTALGADKALDDVLSELAG